MTVCSNVSYMLLGTCGVGWNSLGSLDVIQDTSSRCLVRRSPAAVQDAGAMLSVTTQPYAGSTHGHISSFVTERITDNCAVHQDNATVHSVSETSRHDSADVGVSCSVVDAVSRNRCNKKQTARRKSLNEAVMAANLSVVGLHASTEQCHRSAWRRTKSYDMSACEVTVL